MKKFAFLIMAAMCFSGLSMVGCGSSEPTVVEAPEVEEEDPATAGVDEESYDPSE